MDKELSEKVQRALANGHSVGAILDHLAKQPGIGEQIQTARQSYSDDQIVQYLTSAGAESTTAQRALRQVGLGARAASLPLAGAAFGGMLAGPPGAAAGALGATVIPMVADPLIGLSNQYLGTQLPTVTGAAESLLSRIGLPQPETAQERIVYDINRALAGTAGSASAFKTLAQQSQLQPTTAGRVFGQMAQRPLTQTTAAGLASTAAGTVREQGGSPLQQLGAATMAGMVAPGGGRLPITQRMTPQGVEAIVQPFTQAGREAIAGQALRRLATDPEQAIRNIQQAPTLVPGVRPTTAALARDPGLAAAEVPMRSALDVSGLFPQRLSENQQRILEAFRQVGGRPGSIAAAEKRLNEVTGPLRRQAFQQKSPVSVQSIEDAITTIRSDPAKQRETVDQAMDYVLGLINKRTIKDAEGNQTAMIDPETLYSVRKDISNAMQGRLAGEQANLKLARGELSDVMRVIDQVIEQGAPGYGRYMRVYAARAKGIDQMRALQDIEQRATTGQPNIVTGEPVLRASTVRTLVSNRADELDQAISEPAMRRIDNIVDEINRGQAATAPGVKPPGSDTFKNMSMANFLGRMFSETMASNTTLRTMARPLDFLYKLPDEALQRLMVEAMLDPKLAANLMTKANMLKVEPLARSLRTKAERLGYGTFLGATGAQ